MNNGRGWLVAGLMVAAVPLGVLGWMGRQGERGLDDGLLSQLFSHGSARSMGLAQGSGDAAPKPPPQPAWRTPLKRQCGSNNAQLRQRLLARQRTLRNHPTTLAIDPTNHGERFGRDVFGQPLNPTPQLIVLHETVYGIGSAINTFVTPHPRDEDQVSYHALIGLDGAVVRVLDPLKRAFGAGNSAFNGQWVITNKAFRGSVNNFALHVSLETPLDGENDALAHSGYTTSQYDALAVLLAEWMERFGIPYRHITTHAYVDLGGERADPRSFEWSALQQRLAALGQLCP
jgi:hypothetical protein